MKQLFILLLAVLLSAATAEPSCDDGWLAYKDELCVKAFTNLERYDGAKEFCASQGDDIFQATLVMVKDSEMQQLLANYTDGSFDYIWLGGRYNTSSSQFRWENGKSLRYSNWISGYPRANPGHDDCIEMRPSDLKNFINIGARWSHETCKRNLVMCQKPLKWSLQDAVNEIIGLRRRHETEQNELKNELARVNSRVVPVGSIYVEYYNQPSPRSLWPTLTWEDITSSYAGLFFRAFGGDAASWGTNQSSCAPRITQMQALSARGAQYQNPLTFPASGWSPFGHAGRIDYKAGSLYEEGLRFYTQNCEIRPRNQAIRIWKRTD